MKQVRLKVPARILPDIPKKEMDLVSINRADFVPLPLDGKAKNYKPIQSTHVSGAPFKSDTSYNMDYPTRVIERSPIHKAQEPTWSIARSNGTSHHDRFVTTNKVLFRKWSEDGRQDAYCEPPQHAQIFLGGKFDLKSVSQADYTAEILMKGRPSTSCKKVESMYQSNGKFTNATTNNSTYNLPKISERVQLNLRNESKKNNETLEKMHGNIQGETQYRRDNPGYHTFPLPRGICPPAMDKLSLFQGHFNGTSEHRSNYTNFCDPPRPRTSFKKTEKSRALSAEVKFDGSTTTQLAFQPIPIKKQKTEHMEVTQLGADISEAQKKGERVKKAQHFGLQCNYTTTNKNEYFQFWKTRPRVRYGDRCERVFKPSSVKFASISETRSSYVPLKASPSQSFKQALDFSEGGLVRSANKAPMNSVTAYREEFPVRNLPQREVCPAEALL